MYIRSHVIALALICVNRGSAQPTKTRRDAFPWGFNPSRDGNGISTWPSQWVDQCSNFDLAQAQFPIGMDVSALYLRVNCTLLTIESTASAPTPLPSPTGTLSHVAIGRGVQNYTCDLSDPKATPVPVGALATLYNVSCIAATDPWLLSYLPNIAYSIRLPTLPDFFSDGASSSSSSSSSASQFFPAWASSKPTSLILNMADDMMIGHHFFINDTTPRFDLDTANGDFGCVTASKIAESDAPSGSTEGSVAWLYLTRMKTYPGAYSEVYRLNTVGGAAPATCRGVRRKEFRV